MHHMIRLGNNPYSPKLTAKVCVHLHLGRHKLVQKS